jgi:gliding motility-associated-like protein
VADGFCVGQDTITVLSAPDYPPFADVELCPGEREVLVVPFAASEVVWSNGTTENSLVAETPGIYWYAAQDGFGCSYTDTVVVTFAAVPDEEPFIPNVFTPNGDGKNERYLPVNIDDSSFSMDIYNRWGMKVYGSVNSTVGWNGKLDNSGEPVPDGTYFVVLTYSAYCDNKQPVTVTGHVTLLR